MAGKKQFDPEAVLEAAMLQFWRAGYSDTSVDDLCAATGLNRSSLYSSLKDKESLFLACLDRYVNRYGKRYDAALAPAGEAPLLAVRNFFDVTLTRIADPGLPDGCLVAQTTMAIPTLSARVAERTVRAFRLQHSRVGSALASSRLSDDAAEAMTHHVVATNHSLAVMSRAHAEARVLRSIVDVTLMTLDVALSTSC